MTTATAGNKQAPRLLEQVRAAALTRYGRPEPGERFVKWSLAYILFHSKRHPRELGRSEAGQYLEHVVKSEKDPLRCVEAARAARKGPAGVTSPLDVLGDVDVEGLRAAVARTEMVNGKW